MHRRWCPGGLPVRFDPARRDADDLADMRDPTVAEAILRWRVATDLLHPDLVDARLHGTRVPGPGSRRASSRCDRRDAVPTDRSSGRSTCSSRPHRDCPRARPRPSCSWTPGPCPWCRWVRPSPPCAVRPVRRSSRDRPWRDGWSARPGIPRGGPGGCATGTVDGDEVTSTTADGVVRTQRDDPIPQTQLPRDGYVSSSDGVEARYLLGHPQGPSRDRHSSPRGRLDGADRRGTPPRHRARRESLAAVPSAAGRAAASSSTGR